MKRSVASSKGLAVLLLWVACGGKSAPPTGPDPVEDPPGVEDDTAKATPDPAPPPPPIAKGNPRNDLIPRSILFGNPERARVTLSPDGKHVAWLAPKDGLLNVWVAPADKLDQAKPVTNDTVRPIRNYFWAYTNKHVLYQQDTGGDENFHVFATDITDGKTTDLTPYKDTRAEVMAGHHKQPTKFLVSMNDRNKEVMDVYKLDVLTGKRELVVQNDDNFIGFTVDNAMNVRLANKKLPDGGTGIFILGADKKWKPFETIGFEDADTTNIVGFAPGDKSAYMLETRGRDTGAVVSIDLATKKSKVLAENPKADASGFIVHPTKYNLQAVSFEYDRETWTVLDRSINRDLAALKKLEPNGDIAIQSRTLDDKKWIVATTSEQRPGRYYVWDRAKQKETFLFSVQPELEKQPLVKMTPVIIKSRDGLDLVSYLTLPSAADPDGDGKANTPVPMVLWVHGGPWARDDWGFDPVHQMLANRGYATLSVNYRGSTGFGKKFMNAGNLQWGKAMHEDLIDAVGWAVQSGVAPKDKICIGGGSYGGYATLVGVAMTPDVFACGVDIVGVANLHTFLSSIPAYWKPFLAFLHARVGNPETPEGKALLTERSPLTHAKQIKRPLLIGQGANDPRVKQAESEQIVAAMKQHGLPVTYVLFPDEGHGFARPPNAIAFFAVMEAFLSAHLGGFYQPITPEELKASSMQIKDGKQGIPGVP